MDRIPKPHTVNYEGSFKSAKCNGVIAVKIAGQAILVEEDKNIFWVYGVMPGGIAGGGRTKEEAIAAFNEALVGVMLDIHASCDEFDKFKAAVIEFVNDVNEYNLVEWYRGSKEKEIRKLINVDISLEGPSVTINAARLRALQELAKQAQELNMGYETIDKQEQE